MAVGALVLGLDIGTSRIKALLIDRDGEQAGLSRVATPFAAGRSGTEMTVEDLEAAVALALEGLGPDRGRVVAAGIGGLAESGAPLDDADRVLAPIIAWHDSRGAETVATLQAHFGDELSLRIGQRLRPVSTVAKLGWLIDNGTRPVRRWLGVPELCLFRLTGAQATEHSLAARTGCYDVTGHAWLPEVAERAGFPIDVFPPVGRAGATLGRIAKAGSFWSGLPEGTPVTLAGHDHLAGADGCGADGSDLVNSVGTAETVIARCRELPDMDRVVSARLAVTVLPGADGWAILASAARSGVILGRLATLLGRTLAELDDMAAAADPIDVAALLDALHGDGDGDSDGVTPDLPEDPGSVWAGALDALAARTRDAHERIGDVTGSCTSRSVGPLGPGQRMVVFGGGARSRPWLAAKAATMRLPVWCSTVPEAAARGAALRAGVVVGWWRSGAEAPGAVLEIVPPRARRGRTSTTS